MRKPCFNCDQSEQDNMDYGECYESPLCTDMGGPCWHMNNGGHWEDCPSGSHASRYPAWAERLNTVQCPCCKGSGFVEKTGSVIDEIRALEWYHNWCPICQNIETHGHATGCEFAAILRRLK